MNKLIASMCGIGYMKGGGTVASLVGCAMLYASLFLNINSYWPLFFITIAVVLLGVYVSKKTELIWGKDSYRIVIDELGGIFISMLFLPINFITLLLGLIFFRFFDIVKPLYIRRFENYKNGWGVMLDDVVAGFYANICLQIVIVINKQYGFF